MRANIWPNFGYYILICIIKRLAQNNSHFDTTGKVMGLTCGGPVFWYFKDVRISVVLFKIDVVKICNGANVNNYILSGYSKMPWRYLYFICGQLIFRWIYYLNSSSHIEMEFHMRVLKMN